jgi:hypothetical protein
MTARNRLQIAGVVTAILMVVAAARAGGDPWKDKPFDQWTDNDIAGVLQASPWAKVNVQAGIGSKALDTAPVNGPISGTTAGSGDDISRTPKRSVGTEPGHEGLAAMNIFWFSSRTIRSALARRAMLHSGMDAATATKFAEQPQDEYQIMAQGSDMAVFQERGEEAFADAAFLEIKKTKQKIQPSHVLFQKGVDGTTVLGVKFFFPKKDANGEPSVSPDEREIDFYLRIGANQLKTFFDLKKMTDSKGEDL